ncbi:hypothetical protein FSP39_018127 [Pinctada imbricata]|uniref:Uncharacterized protein n=1 Tax=Pinctada imbricata TaxID=66713 RepID=A0AA88XG26_PINIB|nr:hypothetical protein FSP39_018127 [Pinctada imbricata]
MFNTNISRKHAFTALVLSILATAFVRCDNDNKMCERLRRRDHTKVITEPCVEAYKARCGWFSLTYCTFYHKVFCTRIENTTEVSYYAVLECCDGFLEAPNGTCLDLKTLDQNIVARIKNETAGIKNKDSIVNPEDIPKVTQKYMKDNPPSMSGIRNQREPSKSPSTSFLDLSHGAYAGIICAMVLVLIIMAFIIIAIRKKKIRQSKRNLRDSESGMQRVVYHSSPVVIKKFNSSPSHTTHTTHTTHMDGEVDMQINVPATATSEPREDNLSDGVKDRLLDDSKEDRKKEVTSESSSPKKQRMDDTDNKEKGDESDDVTVRLLDGASGQNEDEVSHDTAEDLRLRLHHSTETNI